MTRELIILLTNLKESFVAILAMILAFLSPIVPLLLLVGVAIALDTILGCLRARKLGQKITSRKLSQVVSKMVLYQTAVILFFCIEKYVLSDIIGMFTQIPLILTKLVTSTLLFIELLSINENLNSAYGFNLWTKFKDMVGRAKSVKDELEDTVGNGDESNHA